MRLFARLLAAAAVLLALAAPAFAQTDEQRAALSARIDSFDAAMKASNMAEIMGVVPPKIIDKLAATYSVTKEQLVAGMQQQIDAAMANIKLVSFGMDLSKAEFVTLADGTLYAMVPTETVMDLGEQGKFKSSSSTLALLDGDTWYLIRAEDPQQQALLKEIYPAFADVTFPAGTMEPVTE
jgi:hypothetical protein